MTKRILFAAALAFVSGLHAAVPEPVTTDAGLLSGTPAAAPGVRVFKGIPFAAPPLGELRWRAPQPVAKWTGVRTADTFGSPCVQPKGTGRLNVAVDLPDSLPELYPAGSDEEATRSSQMAFRDELAWHMRLYASLQAKRGHRAYWYFVTHEPPYAPAARNLKATHAVEIPYVFNNLRPPRLFPDTSSPELASASGSERARAERVSSYWVNFARTGDPNGRGLPRWPAFAEATAGKPPFGDGTAAPMIIGEIKEAPDPQRLAIYDKLHAGILAGLRTAV